MNPAIGKSMVLLYHFKSHVICIDRFVVSGCTFIIFLSSLVTENQLSHSGFESEFSSGPHVPVRSSLHISRIQMSQSMSKGQWRN